MIAVSDSPSRGHEKTASPGRFKFVGLMINLMGFFIFFQKNPARR
jgi:hypothetical protein